VEQLGAGLLFHRAQLQFTFAHTLVFTPTQRCASPR